MGCQNICKELIKGTRKLWKRREVCSVFWNFCLFYFSTGSTWTNNCSWENLSGSKCKIHPHGPHRDKGYQNILGTKLDHSVEYFRHHYRHHSLRGFLAVLLILLALTIRWFFEALAVSQDSFQQLAKKVFPRVKKNTTLWSSWNLLGLFSWHSWEHNQWECEQNSLQFRPDPLTWQEQTIM